MMTTRRAAVPTDCDLLEMDGKCKKFKVVVHDIHRKRVKSKTKNHTTPHQSLIGQKYAIGTLLSITDERNNLWTDNLTIGSYVRL